MSDQRRGSPERRDTHGAFREPREFEFFPALPFEVQSRVLWHVNPYEYPSVAAAMPSLSGELDRHVARLPVQTRPLSDTELTELLGISGPYLVNLLMLTDPIFRDLTITSRMYRNRPLRKVEIRGTLHDNGALYDVYGHGVVDPVNRRAEPAFVFTITLVSYPEDAVEWQSMPYQSVTLTGITTQPGTYFAHVSVRRIIATPDQVLSNAVLTFTM